MLEPIIKKKEIILFRKDILRAETRKAIRRGEIKVPDICEDCKGEGFKLDCHHNDDNNPYDVSFLCGRCHQKRHNDGGREMATIPRAKCKKCGHEWLPRIKKPEKCPRCKSSDW